MKRAVRFFAVLVGTAVAACAQVTLLNNLTAYYAFNGTATDGSGSGYDLTLASGTGFATGLFGQALNPAGNVSHYAARLGDDNALDFGTADFTVQIWVNYNATTNEQVLVEKFTGATGPGWSLTKLSNNAIGFVTDNGASPTLQSSGLSISLGTWHQVVARRTGTNLELFFDGASVAFNTISGSTSGATSDPLLVGRRDSADGRGFSTDGSLDELAIWSRALSNAEITTLFNSGTGLAISAIPEPASYAAAFGLFSLFVAARQTRRGRSC